MATIVHDTDLICRDCGLEFRRLDHLKRHAALHNGRKPFACSACGRSFSRRDTLQRHIAVHQPSDPAVSPQAISATDRSEAACSHCRASKLKSELERLYAGEAIPGETGSFARLLILFGTYRDSLFLKQAHDSGLSLVLNTHGQAVSHDDLCKRPAWDILDPERRGSTGGGMESMIFQSYHLIGLSQYFTVNELYSFSGFEVTPLEQRETTRRLASWCAQNGDSARKAAMHAGRLFSHCQSSLTLRGYQEPRVMLIATLALWAYSTLPLTPLLGPFGRCSPSTCTVAGSSSPDAITTCRIDRSSDDSQAARDWVRSGCHTRCFIEGLGNLHGPNADARIVRRAIALLATLHEWRLGRAIARELKRLFDVFWVER
ncbi:fungal transcription factor [Colletotrichum plurivorum]|uniref:Fungal transcription factor n=1 Tax=Colletotrichum plurivorum TaxID=2175906 RepID=A0A8H6KJZ5_9PEZI|nr:fungal transcription factor [Colletotrichum plurivorum]